MIRVAGKMELHSTGTLNGSIFNFNFHSNFTANRSLRAGSSLERTIGGSASRALEMQLHTRRKMEGAPQNSIRFDLELSRLLLARSSRARESPRASAQLADWQTRDQLGSVTRAL